MLYFVAYIKHNHKNSSLGLAFFFFIEAVFEEAVWIKASYFSTESTWIFFFTLLCFQHKNTDECFCFDSLSDVHTSQIWTEFLLFFFLSAESAHWNLITLFFCSH